MDEDLSVDNPDGYQAVPWDNWHKHSWLSRLDRASDAEMDKAWFWQNLNPNQIEALQQIIVQHREIESTWKNAIPLDGRESFPSRDWGQPSAGWYDVISLFPTEPHETRALIPNEWIPPEFDTDI